MSKIDWHRSDNQYIDVNGYRLEVRCTTARAAGAVTSGVDTTRPSPGTDAAAPSAIVSVGAHKQTGPVIVLLHDGLGCVELWREFPDQLCERTGCPVVVYSRAGYGASDPVTLPRPLNYMTHEATDVLPLVLDAIGARKYILVGHSDGATIAAINGGSTTDYRVRGLVLLAPHFFTETKAITAITQTRDQYVSGSLREKLARYHKHVDVAFNGWCNAWLDPTFVEWNVADCIDYIRVPVLAIQGTADEYGTLAQIEELKSRIYAPFEETIVADCGHTPHHAAADATLSSIAGFVERLIAIEQSPNSL